MSRETRDSDYRPKRKTLPKRTPRRSMQVDSINYAEYETESDTGSSALLVKETILLLNTRVTVTVRYLRVCGHKVHSKQKLKKQKEQSLT